MTSRPVIFISAVSKELHSARQLVANTLTFLGYEPEWQDIFDAGQGDLRGMLRRRVDASAGVVQIVGKCYGAEPPAPDAQFGRVSYTQYEALYARQRGKKVWYLFLDDGFPADPHDPEPDDITRLQTTYRESLRTGGNLFHPLGDARDVENTVLKLRDELTRLRRRGTQVVLAILLLLAVCAGGVVWLMKSGGQTRVQLDDTQKQIKAAREDAKAMREEMAALSKGVMEFAGTKSRIQQEGGKQTEAEMDDKTYAALAKELGIPEKLLREKLRPFAGQLAISPTAPPFVRANAAYVAKDYVEAERLALLAADDAKAASPPRPADAIAAYRLAGLSARDRVQYAATRKHFESAAALTEKGRDLLEWADVQNEIAWLLYLDGKYPEQEALARRVWEACRLAGKGEERIGMTVRHRWANALAIIGKSQQAEHEYRELIPIRERVLGAEHPDTLRSRHNLAHALICQEKNAEAEREYRELIPISERVLGAEHLNTLMGRNNLGVTLCAQGKSAEAEQEHRAVLAIRERVLGVEHLDTLQSRDNLATALRLQGKYAEAEQEHRAVLKIRVRLLGAEHPDTLASRMCVANALFSQAKYAEAEQEHRAVLTLRERVLGAEHPDTLASRNNLAIALQAQGKYAEAEQEHRSLLKIRERILGAEHPDVFQSCFNLALCLEEQQKLKEALGFMQRAEKGHAKALGSEHKDAKDAKRGRERIEAALVKGKSNGPGKQ